MEHVPDQGPGTGPAERGASPSRHTPDATREDAAITVRSLIKDYGPVHALRGIDLEVRRGEVFALLGPNGAGKTTLFSILATLRKPTSGDARVFGKDVEHERTAIRREIGIVFQEPALDRQLSARANLELMGLFYGLPRRRARERAEATLERLGMSENAERPPERLSGGQRRRLELARAIISEPRLLFLDEATLGLDVDARRSFWDTVRDLAAGGTTVFLTTHYMEEAEIADRIAMIADGRIVALDAPERLRESVGGGLVRLSTDDDGGALAWLGERGYRAEPSEEGLFIVTDEPASLLPELLKNLPQTVMRAEVRQPSLEDAFLRLTGTTLERGTSADVPSAGGQAPRGGGR